MLTCSLGAISSSGPARWKQVLFSSWESRAWRHKGEIHFSFPSSRAPHKPKRGWLQQSPKCPARGHSGFCLKNGIVRLQIQDRRISQRPAQAQSTEKFFPSLVCQELDSGRVLVARAAKVQRNPDIQERKEDTDKARSESMGDWCFFWSLWFSPQGGLFPFKLQVWE